MMRFLSGERSLGRNQRGGLNGAERDRARLRAGRD